MSFFVFKFYLCIDGTLTPLAVLRGQPQPLSRAPRTPRRFNTDAISTANGHASCPDYSHGQLGQVLIEAVLILASFSFLLWGLSWTQGESGLVSWLIEALRGWHARFSAGLSLPM